MKRLAFLLSLLLATTTIHAQTGSPIPPPKAPVWQHGTEEFLLEGNTARVDGHLQTNVSGGWLHYATDAIETGAIVALNRTGADGTSSAGGAFFYNFPQLKKGNFFVGGIGSGVSGLSGVPAELITSAGYRLYVGKTAALRVHADWGNAVGTSSGADTSQVNQTRIFFGFSMGVPQGSPVQ